MANLDHFMLECQALQEKRAEILGLQQPYIKDREKTIGKAINSEIKELKEESFQIWRERRN